MKHTLHRLCAMVLLVAILLSVAVTADSKSILGQQTSSQATVLADGATLYSTTYYNSTEATTQAENMIIFQAGTVTPIVAYGETLYGRSTLSTTASYLAQSTDLAVVAGINASFFEFSTGIPYGLEITQGVVRSSGSTTAVGFTAAGSAIIGDPGLSISLSCSAGSYASINYNKATSTSSGLVLYSRDYDSTTRAEMATYNVILQPTSDELHIGDTLQATVIQASTYAADAFSIPEGCWVLSIAAQTTYQTALSGFLNQLKVGDVLTISVTAESGWEDVVSACGAGDMLVVNSIAQTSFPFSATTAAKRTARTALGIKADGSILLYTVDGDQADYSDGLTLTELAQRLVELGCVTAVNLDGGGSTTMGATVERTYSTINTPSDSGSQRKVANGIYLITAVENLPAATSTTLPSDTVVIIADAQTEEAEESTQASAASSTAEAASSSTATSSGQSASIQAVSAASGVTVFGFETDVASSNDGISASLNTDSTYIRYGSGSLQLSYDLEPLSYGETVRRQAVSRVTIPLRDDRLAMGIWVYGDGSGNALSVKYTVDGTEYSLWIGQLTFTGWSYLSTTLPTGAESITGFAITQQDSTLNLSGCIYLDQVLLSTTTISDVTAPTLSLQVGESSLEIGVTDDGSGVDTITVTIDGTQAAYTWSKHVASIALPEDGSSHLIAVTARDGAGNLASLTYETAGNCNSPFADTAESEAETAIVALYTRGILSGWEDEATGQLIYSPEASMTRQEFAVALIRWLGIDTAQYAEVALPYADASSIASWALDSMKAAYALGIMSGSEQDGQLYCSPTNTLTRQEAVTLIDRTQEQGYEEASLSAFSDAASIATWAQSHVAVLLERGILSAQGGSFCPAEAITRGQVAQLLYLLG